MANNNSQLVQGLRDMADFLQEHPEALPSWQNVYLSSISKLREVAKRGYGRLEKEAGNTYFRLVKQFGPRVQLAFIQPREEVCKRVQVGKKIIPATPEQVIEHKAREASTEVVPATPEREEPIFEWHCPDSLLATPEEIDAEAAAEAATLAQEPEPAVS